MQARAVVAPADWPRPGEDALAHSRRLEERIRECIRVNGDALAFGEYMRLVLYEPGLGYYSAGTRKFGAAGDFVTAPEISPLFSRLLARQCAELLEGLGGGEILELGAGSGTMAADVLAALDDLDCPPERYRILDVSADLRQRQREVIGERAAGMLDRVEWLDALPRSSVRGLVLGNEVLDALPVERFRRRADDVLQASVIEADGRLALDWRPASGALAEAVAAIENRLGRRFAPGYTSEVCLGLPGWVADVAGCLAEGVVLFSDYGLPESDYYAEERDRGTFRCHYRHRAHEEALLYPGLQDLTAWVDFSALARAGCAAGLGLAGYTTQAHFLLAAGLEAELAGFGGLEAAERLSLSGQIKTLTLPGQMGEVFKFMAFRRGCETRLRGFALRDLRATL